MENKSDTESLLRDYMIKWLCSVDKNKGPIDINKLFGDVDLDELLRKPVVEPGR